MEDTINKLTARLCLALGIACGVAVICGAWWHLFTTAICLLLYKVYKSEE